MPTYDYHCTNCGHKEEAFQKITDAPLIKCSACGKDALQRGPGGGIGLAFKGKGYYTTDYSPQKTSSENKPEGGCCPCGKNKKSCDSTKEKGP